MLSLELRRIFIGATVLASLALAGCANNMLYQWGGYEDGLYAAYKDPTKAEALRLKLEAHVQAMEKGGQKVAPGLYAEVGTLYLQAGQRRTAMTWYQKERAAWPESRQLMTAMIQNLERLEAGPAASTTLPASNQEVAK